MSIIASALVPVETAAAKDDLWQPQAIFLPDWAAGVVLTTSWATNIATSDTAAETRTGAALKPSRSIEFTVSAIGVEEILLLRSVLNRGAMARTPVPLFCDGTVLSNAAPAGAPSIDCDTSDRRFFPGGRIVIIDLPATTVATSFEFATIDSVAADSITLTSATAADHDVGALVFPIMEADLVPQLAAGAATDEKATVRLVYRETVGAMTLDPMITPGNVAAGYNTFSTTGIPIFIPPLGPDWSKGAIQIGVNRLNESTKVGLFNYIQTHGTRPAATMSLPFLMVDRASFASVAAFFDSRAGRQKSFFAVSPTADFVLASQPVGGGNTIELQAIGPELDWSWRKMLALELADGTVVVVQVASVARGTTDVVTIDAALPALPTPVLKVSNAYLMRFDSDEISEAWATDSQVSFSLGSVELISELSITLPALEGHLSGSVPNHINVQYLDLGGTPRTSNYQFVVDPARTFALNNYLWSDQNGDPIINMTGDANGTLYEMYGIGMTYGWKGTIDPDTHSPPLNVSDWTKRDPTENITLVSITVVDWILPPY